MRAAILALWLFQMPSGDERVVKWNAFADAANKYINTVSASEKQRKADKEQLGRLWKQVYDCPCF